MWLKPEAEAHLCVVRAYTDWIGLSGISRGHIFRNIIAGDAVELLKDQPMVNSSANADILLTPPRAVPRFLKFSETTSCA